MYISILILPLMSVLLVGLFGRVIGITGAKFVSNIFIFLTFLVSVIIFYEVSLSNTKVNIELWEWFSLGALNLHWSFMFDSLTAVMLIVVTGIASLVHLYSISYMAEDPHIVRFLAYLSLFTLFMIILVTSNNFGQLFIGWEGVGISSYLLINFWFTRVEANQAAIKAILVNRFGDIGILICMLTVFFSIKSLDFDILFCLVSSINSMQIVVYGVQIHILSLISVLLFIGAIGKSAQLGLHTWLPDAMEGPTPVSALIHAATMVTAGVFVLIRMSPVLEYSTNILLVITIVGAITAFFAGTVGIFQNDLKRVIAYSTCSQLGYMITSCGLSGYSIALFHLVNHAFFKALLFLSAGAVIHAIFDEQDMRKMGGLLNILPYTYSMFIIGSLSLMGFPYTTGYYSKDIILELSIANYYVHSLFVYWLLLIGVVCTSIYSIRLLCLTFLVEINLGKSSVNAVHDSTFVISVVLLLLSFCSIFLGYFFKDMFIGIGTPFFSNSLGFTGNLELYSSIEAEFLFIMLKLLPIFVSSVCGCLCYYIYLKSVYVLFITKLNTIVVYKFFLKKWYFDVIYNKLFVYSVLNFGYLITFRLLDRGLFEFFGPTGFIRFFLVCKEKVLEHMSGYLYKAVFILVANLIFMGVFIKVCNVLLFTFDYVIVIFILMLLVKYDKI